jgi:general secretion pathway protein K
MISRLSKIIGVSTATRPERGFVVIVVLWIVAMVGALLLIYVNYVANTASLVATVTQRVQTEELIRAAVELTAYQLNQSKDSDRPTHGVINTTLGTNRIQVAFRSEAARIDLNLASKELLAGLMQGLGVASEDARMYADRIVAWRTPAKNGADDNESSYYLSQGLTYGPRYGPFPATDELWLVGGIPIPLIERMIPFVTVFSNIASVSVADAAPEVLAALPGMSPEKIRSILNDREDPSIDLRSLNQQFGGGDKPPKAFRLDAGVRLEQGRLVKAEIVVLLLEDGDDPYRVLSWRDE